MSKMRFLLVLTVLAGCQPPFMFSAGFNADPVDAPPAASPPGDPPGDAIAHTGAVRVVNSPIAGSNAVALDRGSTAPSSIDMVVSGGPHVKGEYRVSWRAYAESFLAPLTISLLSSSGRAAFRATYQHGQYTFATGSGPEEVGPIVPLNSPHTFVIVVDVATKTMIITLNGVTMPARPFVDPAFEDVKRLRFEYAADGGQAAAGTYVIDFATLRK
jgi:hypothetical protein